MDQLEPSGTAAIPQEAVAVFFDNQEHILDWPITKSELDAAIAPNVSFLEQQPNMSDKN